MPGEEISAFAGIWRWSEGARRFAFCAAAREGDAGDLQPEDYDRWLDGEAEDLWKLAQPCPSQLMRVA